MSQQSPSQVSDSTYRHPGHLFIEKHGIPTDRESLLNYPKFLRAAAGLTDQPPIDLAAIYQCFGMHEPKRVPLVDQQGILVDGSTGLILIKADDAIARQRFTEGHELMELLFDAIEQADPSNRWNQDKHHDEKERLCDQGAAELLMPKSQFIRDLQTQGISLESGRSLAQRYQTSLMATLIQMIKYGSGSYALVLWHPALRKQERRKQERRKQAQQKQDSPTPNKQQPKKKLRVRWRCCTADWDGGFIPPNKSVPTSSLITQAHRTQQAQNDNEWILISKTPIHCQMELLPIQTKDETYVLSLLQHLKQS